MNRRLLTLIILASFLATLACGVVDDFLADSPDLSEPAQVDSVLDDPTTIVPEPDSGASQEPGLPVAGEPDGLFETTACPFETDAQVLCGYLTVPENRTIKNSPTIQLAVAILSAPDGGADEPPIIYLEGGPGGSPLAEFDAQDWDFPFTRNRDLIFIDQRGTGYSIPTLDCPELNDESYDFSEENPELDCRQRLAAEGIDFTAYNTTENAADIAALRNALGIDEWDVLGISYGTRLALDLMRFHPEGIRSVILDSPFPPNADTPVDEVLLTYELMEALFAACEEDAYCNETYPDLEAVFLETVARLNDDPVDDLTGDGLVTSVSSAMQDTSLIPLIPLVIYEVAGGNYDALEEFGEEGFSRRQFQDEADRSDSEGMYNSVMCRDEYSFSTYERVEEAVAGRLPEAVEGGLLQLAFETFQMCDFWGSGRADTVENAAVNSSIPTLILVGEFDTATPHQWALLASQTLSNSHLFVFPGAGHSLLTTTDCSVGVISDFLEDPTREPDRSCLDNIEWPYFE